ncbi:MAG TPA: sigma-E processing peptidase SpoIIGA [Candidatus Eisenbergiella intestinipullorum]|nr:sigma-E processing peptidase SpoIIGA [Candidatus Eisenbergiella intestinipullorum]
MKYIVCIDRLFLMQAAQTLALLLLTGTILNRRAPSAAASAFRLILGSGAEALFFCAVFLLPGAGALLKRLLLTAGTLAGLLFIFRIRSPGLLLRAVCIYCMAGFLLAGFLYAFPAFWRESAAVLSALALILAGTASLVWKREKRRREQMVVTAELIEGRVRIVTEALIDSGNTLYDPISERPVNVVERSVLEGRIDLERPERFRLVPYHTLGGRGLMQAIEIERLKVKKEDQEFLFEHVLLGLYNGEVTQSGSYRLILHPALFRQQAVHRKGSGKRRRKKLPEVRDTNAAEGGGNGGRHDTESGDAGENTV